jgi:SprT protein
MSRVEQLDLPFAPPGAASPDELRRRVLTLTAELVGRARAQWPHAVIPEPRVEFRLRGRSAGEACPDTWTTNYNRELLERHGEEFVREIVPHEVAHLVVRCLHRGRVRPHGREWKDVMAFYGAPARASHDFEAPPVPESGRFAYRCGCPRTHWLTRRTHRRVQRGTVEYTCRACRQTLVRAR